VSSSASNSSGASPQNPSPDITNSGNLNNANSSSTPADAVASPTGPVIAINGENPAHIHVGDSYADLGATITAPDADKNLGIKTFLNGALVSDIVIDTSEVATDTVDYVATDPTGLTATSTRTILIELATSPLVLDYTAVMSQLSRLPFWHRGLYLCDYFPTEITEWQNNLLDSTKWHSPS
jgi:hypothetical protein